MTTNRAQLVSTLNQFYSQPIARVSLELLLSLLAITFFALFAIRPTLLTMSDLIKEIEDKRKLDTALSQKIAALSSAQNEFLALESRLTVLDEAIPSNPNLVEAIKILEKTASDRQLPISGLTINEIPDEPLTPPAFENSKRLQVTAALSVVGDYPTIRQYIEDLRNTQRLFVIDTVTFSTNDEVGQKTLEATITLHIPYFGVEKTQRSSDASANSSSSDKKSNPAAGESP